MKKKLFILIVIAALIFPIANLVVKPDNSGTLSGLKAGDARYTPVAHMLEKKCAGCHFPDAVLPFYASFPVISTVMETDIDLGLRAYDMKKLFATGDKPIIEPVLAKLEHVAAVKNMPPLRYLSVHWDSTISAEDQEAVKAWVNEIRKNHYMTEGVAPIFASEVVQPLPAVKVSNPEMVALGDRLYHDKLLSGDNTISCATCHALDKGGTDQLQFSKGIDDQVGGINAPTVYNAVFCVRQFWDGRAADLKEQAGGPVTNPIEMGAEWPAVIAKLQKEKSYTEAFGALFEDGITNDNIQTAIAAFEETLVTTGSKFDKYLMGDGKALTREELEGYTLFKDQGCATCHAGTILGGKSFEFMGLRQDYFADRGNLKEEDNGLFNFTKEEADRHKFKVPTLRNLTATFPYFHDGSTSDLREAVRVMGKYQNDVDLSDKELDLIVGFLKTLNGEYKGTLIQ